jgi:UDP-GlcNAc:undecaprenyl-phosphate GlcNAc-1-phosphate transferase
VYVIVFAAAALVALAATPLARALALRLGVLDRPDARKMHRRAMPLLGGVALAAGFAAGLVAAYALPGHRAPDAGLAGLALGSLVIIALGIYDDRWGADARVKLTAQSLAALIVIASGTRIDTLTNPFGGAWHLGALSVPVSLLWIVGITNALNLIDGLDGLAAGIGAIVSLTLFAVAIPDPVSCVPVAALALSGASAGFLRWNFPPGRIFLGDTGSLLLGFVIAVIGMEGFLKGTTALALLVPIVALGVPVADTALAIVRRGARRAHLFQADREHLHHRLVRVGLSPRQAVLVLYWVSISLALTAIGLKDLPPQKAILVLAVALMAGVLSFRSLVYVERRFARLYGALAILARENRAPGTDLMRLVNAFHADADTAPPAQAAAPMGASASGETEEAAPGTASVAALLGRPGTARKILEAARLRGRAETP